MNARFEESVVPATLVRVRLDVERTILQIGLYALGHASSLGECGIDLEVDYDETQKSLVVYLRKGNKEVKHFLPSEDADACLEEKKCVALGLEIAQLRDERYY